MLLKSLLFSVAEIFSEDQDYDMFLNTLSITWLSASLACYRFVEAFASSCRS